MLSQDLSGNVGFFSATTQPQLEPVLLLFAKVQTPVSFESVRQARPSRKPLQEVFDPVLFEHSAPTGYDSTLVTGAQLQSRFPPELFETQYPVPLLTAEHMVPSGLLLQT